MWCDTRILRLLNLTEFDFSDVENDFTDALSLVLVLARFKNYQWVVCKRGGMGG